MIFYVTLFFRHSDEGSVIRNASLNEFNVNLDNLFVLLNNSSFFLYTDCFTVVIVFFGEIGTHPNMVFLQLVRYRG